MPDNSILLSPILLPAVASLLALAMRKSRLIEPLALLATLANLVLAVWLWMGLSSQPTSAFLIPNWLGSVGGLQVDFALKLFQFPAFILLASAGFSFLVALYSWKFMACKEYRNQYYGYLLVSMAMVNGAVLADNLLVMLFFWEALLAPLFGMIAIGRPGAWKTAVKAFVIVGISDLCMMLGIILFGIEAKTLSMSGPAMTLGGPLAPMAFVFLMIGAISKAGSMPFHSWIPDAAVDAPLPFMAFLPASLEKLLGIYLLGRISLDLFQLEPGHWTSTLMMTVGAITILLAVMMALVQKDYKRLLSFHAISQVGYMVLGIGTALPIGIVGGLFHMINHAMYKSCLFLTGGSVEHATGTTDLNQLGGLARKMPITVTCFVIAAASISGCPPFNGFFSKELVYAGALERGWVFWAAAVLGTFLTAASFLKLGHAAYFGKGRPEHRNVKEVSPAMWLPMAILAAGCVLFGLWNALPLQKLIEPFVQRGMGQEFAQAASATGGTFAGLHLEHLMLPAFAVGALLLAVLNHAFGVKRSGSGLHAVDHVQHAPLLEIVYEKAEQRWFDPYELFLKLTRLVSGIGFAVDRLIDWVYDGLTVSLTQGLSFAIRAAHTGSYAMYVLWCLVGAAVVVVFLMNSF